MVKGSDCQRQEKADEKSALQFPTNFLVFKMPISVKKIQKQVILSYKNALFSPSTQIKEIPYKNS